MPEKWRILKENVSKMRMNEGDGSICLLNNGSITLLVKWVLGHMKCFEML